MRYLLQTILLCFCLAGSLYPQAVLEDFSSMRLNNSGDTLWKLYNGTAPNQSGGVISNGMYKVIADPSSDQPLYFEFFPFPYVAPGGFAQSWVESGAYDPNATRLRWKFKCDHNMPKRGDGGSTMEVGTYVKNRTNTVSNYQGQHYYHSTTANIYAGRWMLFTMNRRPTHKVGDPGSQDYPEDPEWTNPTTGAPIHYFDGLTRFYFTLYAQNSQGATCYFDDFSFDRVTGEADASVYTVTATHSGTAYEVAWNGPKNQNVTYDVRYSTTSMKPNNFLSGSDGGAANTPGNDYTGVFWKSPNMAEQPVLYVAIRPRGQTTFTEVAIPAMNSGAPGCDINGDGVTTGADVTLATDAALGKTSCTADLDGNGRCNVIDVQRVANAALGGSCRTGN
jgi:hypothetical protein